MKGTVIPFGTKSATAVGTGAAAAVALTLGTTGLESGGQHVIDWIHPSFDGSATGVATLTITAGGATKYSGHVKPGANVGSPFVIRFDPGLECGVGNEVVVTLGTATAITGYINLGYR